MPLVFFVAEKEGINRNDVLQMSSIEFYELFDHHLAKLEMEWESMLKGVDGV